MRILFLSTQLPYPPKSGGLIKSWNLVEHLSKHHDVVLIHPYKNDEVKHSDEFRTKINLADHFAVPIGTERSAMNLIKSYLGHASLNVFRNYHRDIQEKVDDWSQTADIIFVDHYEMGQYVPLDFLGKVVLHQHNAEFVMWKRLGELEMNPIKKMVLNLESKRILEAEKKYCRRADLILAAPNDIDELASKGVDRSKMEKTYHLGEDFMLEKPDMQFNETKKALLYIGTLTWEANVDGLLWFFENCWNRLRQMHSDLTLTIVGKNPDARILRATESLEGIHFTGFVEDLEDCYPTHRVFIVPLRFGSGIKVKILNALYRGIPTVTSSIGTEGLDAEDGIHIYESSVPMEYCNRIDELLTNKEKWTEIRDASRALSKQYTWKSLLAAHDAQLAKLTS